MLITLPSLFSYTYLPQGYPLHYIIDFDGQLSKVQFLNLDNETHFDFLIRKPPQCTSNALPSLPAQQILARIQCKNVVHEVQVSTYLGKSYIFETLIKELHKTCICELNLTKYFYKLGTPKLPTYLYLVFIYYIQDFETSFLFQAPFKHAGNVSIEY